MTIEEVLNKGFVGKRIMVIPYRWDIRPDDDFLRCIVPGDEDYFNSNNFTSLPQIECEIIKVNCSYDLYDGISISLDVLSGNKSTSISITPSTKINFI